MKNNKILYIDNLRALIIVLMVAGHAVHPFKLDGGELCNFPDPSSLSFFNIISELGMTFRMPMLFFISGYMMAKTLYSKTASRAFIDRLHRLGIPLIFGLLTIAPLNVSIESHFQGQVFHSINDWGTFIYTTFMAGKLLNHLWFMPFLLLLNSITIVGYHAFSSRLQQVFNQLKSKHHMILCLMATVIFIYVFIIYAFYGRFHIFRLFPLMSFFAMPAMSNLMGYLLGIFTFEQNWLTKLPAKFHPKFYLLAIMAYCIAYLGWATEYYFPVQFYILMPFLYGVAVLTCGVLMLAFLFIFAQHKMNCVLPGFNLIRKHSYAIFLSHYPIVTLCQAASPHIALPAIVKFSFFIIFTLASSLLISILVLQKIPILNEALYGRKPTKKMPEFFKAQQA